MKGHALEEQTVFEEEQPVFEIGVVVPKRDEKQEIDNENCVDVLAAEFRKMGLIVERVVGLQNEILKVC